MNVEIRKHLSFLFIVEIATLNKPIGAIKVFNISKLEAPTNINK